MIQAIGSGHKSQNLELRKPKLEENLLLPDQNTEVRLDYSIGSVVCDEQDQTIPQIQRDRADSFGGVFFNTDMKDSKN